MLKSVLTGLMTRSAIVLLLCSLSLSAHAIADNAVKRPINIPPQSLATALEQLSRQSGSDLVYRPEQVRAYQTHGLVGTFSVEEAARKLLEGTPLTLSTDRSGALLIAAPLTTGSTTSSGSGPQTPSSSPPTGDSLQLAQATPGQTPSPSTVEKPDQQTTEKKPQLQEVVVTGSRIPTVAGNQIQPVLSYTREDIENSGQTTIGEFLSTLPDVSTTNNATFQVGVAGMQSVQLHGLPVGTTLTLLDGRRLDENFYGFFDLSNIPLAAVERIEILPIGASAIYGADSLGGAVNTILRKNFDGLEANATWEHAPGVNNASANLALGKSWERGSVSLMGSYQERGELLGTEREPWSLTSLPPSVPFSAVAALANYSCAPGNVYSVDGTNLPGLGSPEAAIPAGIVGRPTIGQFVATAGKQNLCNSSNYVDITPRTQREGALLSAHYQLAGSVDLFTEVLFSHGHVDYQTLPQLTVSQSFDGTVAANNPYNPFGEAVNVSFAYSGAGTVYNESTSLVRPLIGVRGAFLSDWHYEVTAYLSRDQLRYGYSLADPQLISAALASSNPATALNPFTSGAPGTPQLLSSLMDLAADNELNDRTVSGQGILRGPLLQLPAGSLQAALGGEYSQQRQDTVFNEFGATTPYFLHRNTYAAFSEARIPLLESNEAALGSELLALTLAGRYDHSNDYGGKATWQSGLLWRASETLSLRGGYGLSYQAPQLSEISGPQLAGVTSLFGVADPFRGNQLISYPLNLVSGPNFNLKPETGDSSTLGLQYSSQALPGFQTSLTWYELKITNYIGTESFETLVANPNLFPGAVIRAPPTSQDQQQGYLGVITQLNDLYYNFGDLRIAGFDADVSYAIDTRAGQFTPSVAIANVYKWQSALLPGTPAIDGVSQATLLGVGWSPRWKGTAALAWKQGPLSMNLAGRYIGKYLDYQDFVANTNEIGNTWIFDFNARYEVGQALAKANSWLSGSYVSLGAVNLFDKTPPFSYTPSWYDIQEYDIRGRYLHLNVGVRF